VETRSARAPGGFLAGNIAKGVGTVKSANCQPWKVYAFCN